MNQIHRKAAGNDPSYRFPNRNPGDGRHIRVWLQDNSPSSSSPDRTHEPHILASCFNLIFSPAEYSFFGSCLRYMCSIEETKRNMRHRMEPSSKPEASSFQHPLESRVKFKDVPVIKVSGDLPGAKSNIPMVDFTKKPSEVSTKINFSLCSPELSFIKNQPRARIVLFFIGWNLRRLDLRGTLSELLKLNNLFAEGRILSTIEDSFAWDSGDNDSSFPVLHLIPVPEEEVSGYGAVSSTKETLKDFEVSHGIYEEYSKESRLLSKLPFYDVASRRCHLMLAYRSLEKRTDLNLLHGWLKWSGAWLAYTYLKEKNIEVNTVTMYVRENSGPRDLFKYVVFLEIATSSAYELQELLAVTQRLRVERWSGYTCLYAELSRQEFTDIYAGRDSTISHDSQTNS